jgi:hypothetical protein
VCVAVFAGSGAARLEARPKGQRLAVAWTDSGGAGSADRMTTREPLAFQGPELAAGGNTVLHYGFGRLYLLSRADATLAIVDPKRWALLKVIPLGAGGTPQDVLVVNARTAFLTREGAAHLLRLDLRAGAVTQAADLGGFADEDGVPDLGAMVRHGNRVFVQVRRLNPDLPGGGASPPYLAVVNARTGRLIDADRTSPGTQAIALQGTAPKHRMQVVPQAGRLYVGATGGFFDAGGIEAVNLRTLRSEGLVIRESDGKVGADLGPFVFTAPDRGFLVYSTDLTLSSHLKPFTLAGGVPDGPELHVSVDYAVPSLAYDARARTLFVPDGVFEGQGVFAFHGMTGEKLTPEPVATGGAPTDLLLFPAG